MDIIAEGVGRTNGEGSINLHTYTTLCKMDS